MPGNLTAPSIAVLSAADVRDWQSVTVFQRDIPGPSTVDIDVASTTDVFEDGLSLLNGRGSASSVALADNFELEKPGGGTWDCYIDSNDKFVITSTLDDFSVTNSADNAPFGINTAGQAATGSGPYTVTAENEWVRGPVTDVVIQINSDSGIFNVPASSTTVMPSKAQDVVTMIRSRGSTSDIDDQHSADCLEALDIAACSEKSIRWGINETGHVFTAWRTAASITAPDWQSTTFRDRLGFTGDESTTVSGALTILTADNPMPGVIAPGEPLADLRPEYNEETSVVRLTSGDLGANAIADWVLWSMSFWVGGPDGETDLHRHWFEHVLPYITKGSRVALYQQWGDPRRSRSSRVRNATSDPAYDLLYTTERNGYRGRLRCRRDDSDANAKLVDWEKTHRNRFLAELMLTHLPEAL